MLALRNEIELSIFSCMCFLSAGFVQVRIGTVGIIYPTTLAALPYQAPAYDMAADKVNILYKDRLNLSITYIHDQESADCPALMNNAERLLAKWYYSQSEPKTGVFTAIVCPGCGEHALMNKLAREWNVLYMTSVASDQISRDRVLSPTWIASGLSVTSYLDLMNALLRIYGWSTLYFVSDDNSAPIFPYHATALYSGLTNVHKYFRSVNSKQIIAYDAVLAHFNSISRVFVYFGHGRVLREFLIRAANCNMTSGEHVYLAFNPNPGLWWRYDKFTWQYNDSYDEGARRAYRSLLVMEPQADDQDEMYMYYSEEMRRRTKANYNFTYVKNRGVFSQLKAGYADVQILAQVVSEIRDYSLFQSGAAMARLFLNRTFDTDVGRLYIDSKGEKRADLRISYSDSNGTQQILLLQNAEASLLTYVGTIADWSGGTWPPPDEPRCGYTHENLMCMSNPSVSNRTTIAVLSCLVVLVTLAVFALILYRRSTSTEEWRIPYGLLGSHQTSMP